MCLGGEVGRSDSPAVYGSEAAVDGVQTGKEAVLWVLKLGSLRGTALFIDDLDSEGRGEPAKFAGGRAEREEPLQAGGTASALQV